MFLRLFTLSKGLVCKVLFCRGFFWEIPFKRGKKSSQGHHPRWPLANRNHSLGHDGRDSSNARRSTRPCGTKKKAGFLEDVGRSREFLQLTRVANTRTAW